MHIKVFKRFRHAQFSRQLPQDEALHYSLSSSVHSGGFCPLSVPLVVAQLCLTIIVLYRHMDYTRHLYNKYQCSGSHAPQQFASAGCHVQGHHLQCQPGRRDSDSIGRRWQHCRLRSRQHVVPPRTSRHIPGEGSFDRRSMGRKWRELV